MILFSYIADGVNRNVLDVQLVWRGAWSGLAAYEALDWVNHNGDNFIALSAGVTGTPGTDAGWALMVEHMIVSEPSVVRVTPAPYTWTNRQLLDVHSMPAFGTVVTVNGTQIFQGTNQGTNLGVVVIVYGSL